MRKSQPRQQHGDQRGRDAGEGGGCADSGKGDGAPRRALLQAQGHCGRCSSIQSHIGFGRVTRAAAHVNRCAGRRRGEAGVDRAPEGAAEGLKRTDLQGFRACGWGAHRDHLPTINVLDDRAGVSCSSATPQASLGSVAAGLTTTCPWGSDERG